MSKDISFWKSPLAPVFLFLACGMGYFLYIAATMTPEKRCEAIKADAEITLQAVSACANAPGCQFTSESIRVALEAKAAAESCK